jgi:uncharacterized membrane protein YGL010W
MMAETDPMDDQTTGQRLGALLADYGSYHRTRGNIACHAVGITLILFGVVSLLSMIVLGGPQGGPEVTAAEVAILIATLFYGTLDVRLAIAFLLEAGLLDAVSRGLGDWRVGLAAFIVGWVFQGIGHARFEKNRPAFFRNLIHLMTGPIFLLAELLHIKAPASGR